MVLDRSCLVAAGPGDPGKPPAGAGSGSSPVGVEGAAGATSWARVPLAPGQLGGPPPPLGIGGAVNPEVRLHLHPLLSLLGKLQTQRPLFLQREGSLGLGQCAAGWGG